MGRIAKKIMKLEDLYDQISKASVLTLILLIKQRGMTKGTVFSISGTESLGYPSGGGKKRVLVPTRHHIQKSIPGVLWT